MNNEELEKEIENYLHSIGVGYGGWIDGMEDEDLRKIARHFAQWQSKPKVSEDVEEAAENYAYGESNDKYQGFVNGSSWQKEQMLKEAVEGVVVRDMKGINRVKSSGELPEGLLFGKKVKLIIIKED